MAHQIFRQLKENKMAVAALIVLLLLVFLSVFVPLCSGYTAVEQNVLEKNQYSSLKHWMGTDKFGRDLLVRICQGVRISLIVGLGSTIVNLMTGTLLGGVAGYKGGGLEIIIMRIGDMLTAIPSMLYVILLLLVFNFDILGIIFGICISGWVPVARIVRGEICRYKTADFCLAAKISGVPDFRILWKHLLPNAFGPLLVQTMLMIPQAMFTETFLSFVGVGIGAPLASLGTLIQEGRSQIQVYPMQMLWPILVLCVMMLAFQVIGKGLEDAISV